LTNKEFLSYPNPLLSLKRVTQTSVAQLFLYIWKEIHDLIDISILTIAVEMTGYILPEMISGNTFPILFLFLLLCNIVPIYFNNHQPWTPARTRSYLSYILKVYFFATMIYVLVCIAFAYIIFTKPGSQFDTVVKQVRACAYRYKENYCGNRKTGFFIRLWRMSVERECFALAMCLRQPVFLPKIHAFLMEIWAQVLADAGILVVMVGGFVAWSLSSGRWITGTGLDSPIVNDGHTSSAAPLPSAPKATTPTLEAAFEEFQRARVTSIQRSPEDMYPRTLTRDHSLDRSSRRVLRNPLARNPVIAG
jgi:hypothetical protein